MSPYGTMFDDFRPSFTVSTYSDRISFPISVSPAARQHFRIFYWNPHLRVKL